LSSADRRTAFLCSALALLAYAGASVLSAHAAGIPWNTLGAYFDGHLYLEVARSFPLPFAPEGLDYTGQAPGYPALAWGLRVLLPNALFDWGTLLLLAAWLPAAASVAVFYALCRELDAPALWPTVAFALAQPRGFTLAASPHPEGLALLFALAALLAWLRGRLGLCLVLIAAAGFSRFAAFLLLAPLGIGVLLERRRLALGDVARFAAPPLAFALYLAYLHWRVPGFESVAESHRIFWETHFTWPFRALYRSFDATLWSQTHPTFQLTYTTLAFYLGSLVLGTLGAIRAHSPARWVLVGWVAIIVGVHVSLAGVLGAWDFMRLTLLAWPAALLITALAIGRDVPRAAAAGLAVLACVASLAYARAQMTEAVKWQDLSQGWFLPATLESLDSNEVRWLDFRARAERERARRR